MKFKPYDPESSDLYDVPTRRRLAELREKYGLVELKKIDEESVCVRITAEITGLSVPMAAIGSSVHEAADRLLRIMSPPGEED